jgi:hypothetical protein
VTGTGSSTSPSRTTPDGDQPRAGTPTCLDQKPRDTLNIKKFKLIKRTTLAFAATEIVPTQTSEPERYALFSRLLATLPRGR